MTLEEAIKHAEYIVNNRKYAISVCWSVKDCEQIAEWLRELQERRKQPEIIRCKDCKHYHTDVCGSELGIGGMYGNIIVAHDACDRWTKGMNCVEPEGFCFLAERRTDV